MAAGQRQGGQRVDLQAFFISIGARYKRIRKRPRGKPSPQLYEYKTEKLSDFLDRLSLRPGRRNTVIVLDNASIHRSGIMKEMRPVWESRGLFLFYLPPYSPHLNIAETLWRVLKGKWIRPQDYLSTDSLFYATDRALASVGTSLFVNYSHYAA